MQNNNNNNNTASIDTTAADERADQQQQQTTTHDERKDNDNLDNNEEMIVDEIIEDNNNNPPPLDLTTINQTTLDMGIEIDAMKMKWNKEHESTISTLKDIVGQLGKIHARQKSNELKSNTNSMHLTDLHNDMKKQFTEMNQLISKLKDTINIML